ncbi:GNAT family N-acetyltransferase [Algoriphagus sp. D3-2-R+10]|uniref:GNAT family N-acetyltransferase n=1 Tax=Algoriphagus aurantiacus TaxID=3103948 RepID=UPI002B36F9E6|nr:GNAT family N-acetyltransferase [Algoriphagus sp. D3-2-R+10]MEB2778129.1 GNAT family N-acetyltransferase [Algoriphagus sp. D3-2-R+10]
MTDPSNALRSFQKELLKIPIQLGTIYRELYVHMDQPEEKIRLTYVRLKNGTITSFVNFVQHTPIESTPCFQIGFAVPEKSRNRSLATETVRMALSEMEHGFKQTPLATFFVEAIVGVENTPSQRVAARCSR